MDLVDDLDGVGRRTLLRAHLHYLAVFLLRLNQQGSFGGVVAAGLLDVDMLARLQARRWPSEYASGRGWQC